MVPGEPPPPIFDRARPSNSYTEAPPGQPLLACVHTRRGASCATYVREWRAAACSCSGPNRAKPGSRAVFAGGTAGRLPSRLRAPGSGSTPVCELGPVHGSGPAALATGPSVPRNSVVQARRTAQRQRLAAVLFILVGRRFQLKNPISFTGRYLSRHGIAQRAGVWIATRSRRTAELEEVATTHP